MLQVVPGSQRFYCRADGCSCYSDGNVPYGYCDRHLALFISGSSIVDKFGYPPCPHQRSQTVSEGEIIVKMRKALDTLKEKLSEADGAWMMLDFISAATDESHWMHQIIEAERLSEPYMAERAR